MIELIGVRKQFGSKVAVVDLSLKIAPGEFFAFLGPNGAGKTTTMKLVAGLLRPDRGQIRVCGYDIQQKPLDAKRVLAYIPDQPFLYEKLSGREFMTFVGRLYGMNSHGLEDRIERLADLFGMKSHLDEIAEGYSHGMKQRLVIAATLLHEPKAVVVDEPLVGLDPQTSRLVKGLFHQIAEQGTTIFMSTHVLSIAEETADRIGIITEGQLRAVGTKEELYKQFSSQGGLEELFFKVAGEGIEVR